MSRAPQPRPRNELEASRRWAVSAVGTAERKVASARADLAAALSELDERRAQLAAFDKEHPEVAA